MDRGLGFAARETSCSAFRTRTVTIDHGPESTQVRAGAGAFRSAGAGAARRGCSLPVHRLMPLCVHVGYFRVARLNEEWAGSDVWLQHPRSRLPVFSARFIPASRDTTDYLFSATSSRKRSIASLGPRSSSSYSWRTSISASAPSPTGLGKRLVHSSASSRDFTCMIV